MPDGRVSKKARVEEVAVGISKAKAKTKSKEKPTHPHKPMSPKSKEKQKLETGSSTEKRLAAEATPITNTLLSTFKIVAGSYEKLLYGLEGTVTATHDSEINWHLKPIFIFPAHVSCIKAVAASPDGGKWLATGSADEIVKVWDLRRRKEIGGLMHHEGSITYLHFPSRSHLLSASEDGTLCLFKARDWTVLRTLRGHKGRVNCVAVHPSGKLALSVGKDKTLRMWDFMRGKGCASTKLGKEGEIVRWSTTGLHFAVQSRSTLDIYTANMDLIHTIDHPSRIHDIKFCKRVDGDGEVLLVGAENKKLSIYDMRFNRNEIPKIIAEMVGHENRVKALQLLEIALPPSSGRKSTTIICTVSSDGKIRIFDMANVPPPSDSTKEPKTIEPVTEYDSKGTRLTCVTLADGDQIDTSITTRKKRKQGDSEGEDDGDLNPGGNVGGNHSGDENLDSTGEDEEENEVGSDDEEEGSE